MMLATGLVLISTAKGGGLPDAFAEYDIDGGGGGYVNTNSSQALNIKFTVPDDVGSYATGSLNGFYASPTLKATVVNSAISAGSQAAGVDFTFYYEVIPNPSLPPDSPTTVVLDVTASGSVTSTDPSLQAGPFAEVQGSATLQVAGLFEQLNTFPPDGEPSSFSVVDAKRTVNVGQLGTADFQVTVGSEAPDSSATATLDPLITLDPAYLNDYSLIFGPNILPNPSTSVPDGGSSAAMLAIALASLAVLRRKLGIEQSRKAG